MRRRCSNFFWRARFGRREIIIGDRRVSLKGIWIELQDRRPLELGIEGQKVWGKLAALTMRPTVWNSQLVQ